MKLYTENYPAPNPRKVHIYLAEKGITNVERVHTKMAAKPGLAEKRLSNTA